MNYNFDKVWERRGTDSVKWDFCEQTFGSKDVLPMWVADSDCLLMKIRKAVDNIRSKGRVK